MVEPGGRALDVGCGDGSLLAYLVNFKRVDARGMELSQAGVNACVAGGLSVIQGDADTDLGDYPDDAFDYVILSQTLQATRDPKEVLRQMLRVGKRAIVSFPNFAHWQVRSPPGVRRAHARDAVVALQVVRHAQHPPLQHRRLPRAVPRHGRGDRAGDRAQQQEPADPHAPLARQPVRRAGGIHVAAGLERKIVVPKGMVGSADSSRTDHALIIGARHSSGAR
jgi:SAM-dependent methyltransferase